MLYMKDRDRMNAQIYFIWQQSATAIKKTRKMVMTTKQEIQNSFHSHKIPMKNGFSICGSFVPFFRSLALQNYLQVKVLSISRKSIRFKRISTIDTNRNKE